MMAEWNLQFQRLCISGSQFMAAAGEGMQARFVGSPQVSGWLPQETGCWSDPSIQSYEQNLNEVLI